MNYRTLGRTGLQVSEVGFGAWAIGGTSYGPTRDEESLEALETAWTHGINFYDTADTYGHGHSEDLIAQFIKTKPRDKVILATKVGWDFYHGGSKKNFDADYIRFACEQSLKRLGVETIDLYLLHNPPLALIQSGQPLDVLEALKKQGKIRFIGVSIYREDEARAAMRDARVDALQVVFNIIDQRMAESVFGEAEKNKTGIVVREPLACGILSGKYHPGHEFPKDDHRRRWMKEKFETDLKKVETLKSVLASPRFTLPQAAVEYVLNFEAVSTVIPGVKTKTQMLDHIRASDDPKLRSQEAYQLRDLYHRDEIFRIGLES